MKKRTLAMIVLLFTACAVFGAPAASSATLTPARRQRLLEQIHQSIGGYKGAKYLNACYQSAAAGDNHALGALYEIVYDTSLINSREHMLVGMLKAGKPENEIYKALERWTTPAHVKAIHRAIRKMPQAWRYCEQVYARQNGTTGGGGRQTISQWLKMTVRALAKSPPSRSPKGGDQ